MPETGIQSNEAEAARLFQRGVAAARGGQRRVAAVLLSRAVQLNPKHEMGWLWLSGVLDDPNEIAFCLRSVLSVNPHNDRARQGLAWLEQREMVAAQPAPQALPTPQPDVEEQESLRQARHEGEAWWVNWRRARRDMSRVRLVLLTFSILLLFATLAMDVVMRDALTRNRNLALAASAPPTAVPARAMPAPILQAELTASRDAQVLAYLSALDAPRARLRAAIQTYKDATNQPGGSSIGHAAAARKLREEIETSSDAIDELAPPAVFAQAHADYLAGLELERAALGDMLEFYNSFSIPLANRATLRLEDASKSLDRARVRFDTYKAQIDAKMVAAQTPR